MILQALADLANYQYWWSEGNKEYREQWEKTVSCADKQAHGYPSITKIVQDAVCAEENDDNA